MCIRDRTDGDVKRTSAFATELVAAQPDVILASTTPVTAALHRETTTIPVSYTHLDVYKRQLLFQGRAIIDRLAIAHRLPTCAWSRETLVSGALMSYGPDQVAIARHAAVYVDKIIKGAKPADLPVELPTSFQLLINLKTARALDLTIPESFLVRADEVIE